MLTWKVSAPHGVVDIGPPRQRTVLASLLVDAGRTVMTDTIIDRVWGDEPPARARHALYVYMARLRRILAPAVGPARRTRGYTLEIDLNCVDLHRFSRLVDQGDLLAALQLWRGAPLAAGRPWTGSPTSAGCCWRSSSTPRLFTELQDRYYEGAALDDLGDTLHANGNPDAAA